MEKVKRAERLKKIRKGLIDCEFKGFIKDANIDSIFLVFGLNQDLFFPKNVLTDKRPASPAL